MCPACFTNIVVMAISATSGGGFIALLLKKFLGRKRVTEGNMDDDET